ncbi:MAG: chromate resistance protein ChrB domain-containing protein [Actinomycetota bacterium]
MRWVTRARPKTDRLACPWLIRRFIDPEAEILYVPTDHVAATARAEGAIAFDAPGARYDHRDGLCTFEVLCHEYGLTGDAALMRLARIVHAADIASELHTDPLGPGLLALGIGGLDVEPDDHRLLARATFVYDALYAWSRREVAAGRP